MPPGESINTAVFVWTYANFVIGMRRKLSIINTWVISQALLCTLVLSMRKYIFGSYSIIQDSINLCEYWITHPAVTPIIFNFCTNEYRQSSEVGGGGIIEFRSIIYDSKVLLKILMHPGWLNGAPV